MKLLKIFIVFAFLITVISSCKKDSFTDTSLANKVITPVNLSVLFTITQDNTGTVTLLPNAEGVSFFEIFFGDFTSDSAQVMAGKNITHIYSEGNYSVRIVAHSITGGTSTLIKPLTVSFRAPQNLSFVALPDAANKFKYYVKVSDTTLYATSFQVYFGDVVNEVPLLFLQGDTVSHVYATFGTYTIKVVALSGGAATTQLSKNIAITAAQIDLPVTFDNPNMDYTFIDMGGNATVNAFDTTNNSNKVKRTIKTAGAATNAGTVIGTSLGFANPVPLVTGGTKMSVRVYSPAVGIHVRLKVEDHTNAAKSVETEALSTVANTWETLTFDFSNQSTGTLAFNAANTYDKATIYFDYGNAGTGKLFYWDDVKYIVSPQTTLSLPIDFESSTIVYNYTNFDGGFGSVVNNPSTTGIEVRTKVGKLVKGAGQVWAGAYLTLPTPINFSTKKTFTMKVYSPRVGAKILFKTENITDGSVFYQQEVASTKANNWELMTFNFSAVDVSKSYQKITLIMDNGTVGDGSANYTFYFDDITLN